MATPDGTTVVGTTGQGSTTGSGLGSGTTTAKPQNGEGSLDSLIRAFYDAIASTNPDTVRTAADALIDLKMEEALADGVPPGLAKQAAESYVAELLRGLSAGLPIEIAMQAADNVYAGAVAVAQAEMNGTADDDAVTDLIQAMASGKGVKDAVDHAAEGNGSGSGSDAAAKAAQDAFIQGLTEAMADGLQGEAAIAFAAEKANAVLEASQGTGGADALMQALSSGDGVEATMARLMGSTTQGMDPAAAAAARDAFQRGLAQALDQGSGAENALSDAATISHTAAQTATAVPTDPASALAWALASGGNVDSIIRQIVGSDGMTPEQIAAATRAFTETLSSAMSQGGSTDQAMRSAESAANTASTAADSSGADPLLQALSSGQNVGQAVADAGGDAFANALASAITQGSSFGAATQVGNAAAETATTLANSGGGSDLLNALASGQGLTQAINTAMGGDASADATRAFETALGNNLGSGGSANEAVQTASVASNTANTLSGQGNSGLTAIASGNTGSTGAGAGGGAGTQTASNDGGIDMDAIAAAIAGTETAAGGNTGQSTGGNSGGTNNTGSSSGSSGGYTYNNPFNSGGGSTGTLSGGTSSDPLYTPPSSGSTNTSSGSGSSSSSNTTPPANIAPTAVADSATGHENQTLTIPILGNDSDPDGPSVSLVNATLTTGLGTIQTQGGQIVYAPGTSYDYLDDGDSATVTVRYTIQDSAGAQATTTASIRVTGTNDAPVVALAGIAEDEDVPVEFSAAQFSSLFSDVDANDTLAKIQVTTLPTQGMLQLRGVDVTLNQEIATADLDDLTYVPGSHNNGFDSFEWKGSDGTVYSADAARFDLTLGPVNDAPTVSDPTVAPVVAEDGGILIGGISIDDIDAAEGDGIVTVTFSVDKGSVAISTGIPGGLTPADIQGGENGTGSVTVTASLAAIRTTLADAEGLSYRTAPGDDTDAALTVTVDDRGNSGSGGPLTTTKVIPIDVVPVSDPPVLTTDYAPLAAVIRVVQPIASGSSYDHHFLKDIQVTVNGQAVPHSIDLGTGAQDMGGGVIKTATGTYREFFIRFEAPAEADIDLSFNHQAGNEDPDTAREGLRFDLQVGGSDYATFADRSSAPDFVPGNDSPSAYAPQQFAAHYAVQPDGSIDFSAPQGLAGGAGSSVDLDYVENAITPVDGTIVITDVDSGQLTAAQVSITGNFAAGEDFLFVDVTGTAITANFDPATGVLSLSGADSVANYQQVLRSVAYSNASDAPSTAPRTIAFQVSDAAGGSSMTSAALTRTVTVESVNDAPIALALPIPVQGNEDSDIPVQGIMVADLDAGGADIAVTLTVGDGALTLATNVLGGLAADEIAGNGSDTVTLTGSAAQINATLAAVNGLVYRGDANFNGSDTLSVAVNDLGNSGSGGALASTVQTVAITVDPVNDAPTATVAVATAAGNEDSNIAITGVSVADLDAGGADISVTLTVGDGALTLATNVLGGLAADEIAGNGSGTVTLTGSAAQINATLAAVNGLVYRGDANFNGSDTLSVAVNDLGNSGSGGALASTVQTVAITVDPVNDAPTATVAVATAAGNEDSNIAITGVSVADLDAGGADISVTLTVGDGALTLATNVLGGLAADEVAGNGSGTVTLTGSAAQINATLAAVNGLVYRGDANFNGSDTLSVAVNDLGNSGSGGALASTVQTVAITVDPVNDAPTATVAVATASGNEDSNIAITGVSVADLDAGGADIAVTLTVGDGALTLATNVLGGLAADEIAGNGSGTVTLTGSAAQINATLAAVNGLVYRGDANFNGSDTLSVAVNDLGNSGSGGALASTVQTVAITVDPVNDAPTATVAVATASGNEDSNIAITGVSVADLDAGGTDIAVTLTVGDGALTLATNVLGGLAADEIAGNGSGTVTLTGSAAQINATLAAVNGLVYRGDANFNGSDTLSVAVNDLGNSGSGGALASTVQTVAITVDPVNDAPTATVAVATASGNEDSNIAITGVSVADLDAGGTDIAVTLTVGDGALTLATNVLGGLAADEIAGNGSGTVTLTGSAAQINATLAAVNGLVYRGDANFNGSDTLSVAVNDLGNSGSGGALASTVQTVAITVDPVNDAPTLLPPAPIPLLVAAENFEAGAAGWSTPQTVNGGPEFTNFLGNFGAGASSSKTFSLPGNAVEATIRFNFYAIDSWDNETFRVLINGTQVASKVVPFVGNGVVDDGTFVLQGSGTVNRGFLNNWSDRIYQVTIALDADDIAAMPVDGSGNPQLTLGFTSNLDSVAADESWGVDNLVIEAGVTGSQTPEDVPLTVPALQLLSDAADIDGGALSISAVSNPVGGTVAINPDGDIIFTPTANFNGAASFDYTVSDGNGGTVTGTHAVQVTPVNDAPSVAATAPVVTAEGVAATGTLSVTDIDSSSFTYSVATQGEDGVVSVNAAGQWTYTPAPDFNGADSFVLRVQDSAGSFVDHTIAVTVTPVNVAPVLTGGSGTDVLVTSEDFEGSVSGWSNSTSENGGGLFTKFLGRFAVGGVTEKSFLLPVDATSATIQFDFYKIDSWDNETFNVLINNAVVASKVFGLDTSSDSIFTITQNGALGYGPWTEHFATVTLNLDSSQIAALPRDAGDQPILKLGFSSSLNSPVNDESWGVDNLTIHAVTADGQSAEDVAYVVPGADLVARASDGDPEDTLFLQSVGNATNGSVAMQPDGTVVFTPVADFSGLASFDYTIADGNGGTVTGTYAVRVMPINDAPSVAATAPVTTAEGVAATGTLSVTDVDSGSFTYSVATQGEDGVVSVNAAGQWTYTPAPNFNGTDSFVLRVQDNAGGVTDHTIAVTVTPVNVAPVLIGGGTDVLVASEDFQGAVSGWSNGTSETGGSFTKFLGRFANGGATEKSFTLPEGSSEATIQFSFYRIDSWDAETFRVLINGNVVASKVFGQAGTESSDATFAITDTGNLGFGGVWIDQIVRVTLHLDADEIAALPVDLNGQPILKLGFNSSLDQATSDESWGVDNLTIHAVAADGTGAEDVAYVLPGADLIARAVDGDPEDTLFLQGVGNATNGNVSMQPDGTVVFTPAPDFTGFAGFDYTIADGNGGTVTGTYTVHVTNEDDPVVTATTSGGALQFHGYDAAADMAPQMAAAMGAGTFSDEITIEMMVNFSDLQNVPHHQNPLMLAADDGGRPRIVLEMGAIGSGVLSVFIDDDDGANGIGGRLSSAATVGADEWHHLGFTYDGTTARLYLDGAEVAWSAIPGLSLGDGAQTLTLGADNGNWSTNSMIDEVRLWNVVRTPAEMAASAGQQVPASQPGLVAYYRGDDSTDGTVRDLTGSGRDGVLQNGAEVVRVLGPAVELDGSTDHVRIANDAALNPTSEGTFEAWVRLDSLGGFQGIVMKGDAVDWSYHLQVNDDHVWWSTRHADGSSDSLISTATLDANRWYHLAGVFDNGLKQIYINGALDTQTTVAATALATNPDDLLLGAWANSGIERGLDGTLSDVRIWDVARSADQIADSYNTILSGDEDGLLAYYRFDGDGGVVADASGNGHDGTLVGGTGIDTAANVQGSDVTVLTGQSTTGLFAATDAEGGVSLSVQSGPASGSLEFDAATGRWTYHAAEFFAGNDSFVLRATDSVGHVIDRQFDVNVIAHSAPPVVTIRGVVTDDFNDGVLDSSMWMVVPSSHSSIGSVTEVAGAIQLIARDHLVTVDEFKPSESAPLTVTGTWRFGPDATDFMQVVTRSDGISAGHYGETQNGINFGATMEWNSIAITGLGGAAGTVTASPAAPISLRANTSYNFEIYDDGTNLRFTLTEMGNAANTATVTAVSSYDGPDNHVVFHNREDTWHMSSLDDVSIEHGFAQAMRFSGADGAVVVGDDAALSVTQSLTLEAWVNPDEVSGGNHMILSKFSYQGAGAEQRSYQLYIDETGELRSSLAADGSEATDTDFASGITLTPGSWTHVAMVYDHEAGSVSFYQNGQMVGSPQAYDGGIFDSSAPLVIGGRANDGVSSNNGNLFDGMLDDVRVWNDARTADEIAGSYNKGLNGNEQGLAGYWTFDEATGGTVMDRSANANDGTIEGGGAWRADMLHVQIANNEGYRGLVLGYDPDGGPLTYEIDTGPQHGDVVFDDNTFVYTHHGDNSDDSFSVAVTDQDGQTTIHTVDVNVV